MKVGSLLVLLALLLGIAVDARAATLSKEDRARYQDVIEDAKVILRGLPTDAEYARALEFGILSAYAFSGSYDCFYAGWPSQLTTSGGRRYCARPTSLPHYAKYTGGFSCGSGQMACNPLFFGKGSGTGLCADIGSTAFSQCESKFNAQGGDRYAYLKNLNSDQIGELKQSLQMAKDVCVEGKVGTQKGTGMCARFIAKMNKLEANLADTNPAPAGTENKNTAPVAETKKVARENAKTFAEYFESLDSEPAAPKVEEKTATPNEPGTYRTFSQLANEPAPIKNETCKDCEQKQLQQANPDVPKTFSEIVDTYNSQNTSRSTASLEGLGDDAKYNQIKNKFYNSGKCHRWERLPEPGKSAFKVALYTDELRAFREVLSDSKSSFTEQSALQSLASAMGWSGTSNEMKTWSARLSSLPAKGTTAGDTQRVKFQADLMSEMKKRFDSAPLRADVEARGAKLLFSKSITDCDFPSKEAFFAALAAVRTSGLNPKKGDILTIADRSKKAGQEQVTTINTKTGEVLFQTEATFGGLSGSNANSCSNRGGSKQAPHGLCVTSGSSAAKNGSFKWGTYLQAPDLNGNLSTGRGLAIHEAGGDILGRFMTSDGAGSLLEKTLKNPSAADMTLLLRRINSPVSVGSRPGDTLGCMGVPNESVRRLQDIVEDGSFVYVYCPPSMIAAGERR